MRVCRSARQIGGPRRCPAHARHQWAAALAEVAELERNFSTADRPTPVPPLAAGGLTAAHHEALRQAGIRTTGGISSTGADNLATWGFTHDTNGDVQTTRLTDFLGFPLDSRTRHYLESLNEPLVESIRAYCGPWYGHVNDAILGLPHTHPTAHTHARRLRRLLQWFKEIQDEKPTPSWPCATVVRIAQQVDLGGQDFLGAVFPVGARIETTRITSTTTSLDVARRFAGQDDYVCVFRTRAALPIALLAGRREDEVLIAPGTGFRVVHTDGQGIDGAPTVYLVSDDVAAAAV
jgi:hypothetical protein